MLQNLPSFAKNALAEYSQQIHQHFAQQIHQLFAPQNHHHFARKIHQAFASLNHQLVWRHSGLYLTNVKCAAIAVAHVCVVIYRLPRHNCHPLHLRWRLPNDGYQVSNGQWISVADG